MQATAEALWPQVRLVMHDSLAYNGPVTHEVKGRAEDAARMADLIKFDLTALYAKVCQEKGFTVPKSWDTATK